MAGRNGGQRAETGWVIGLLVAAAGGLGFAGYEYWKDHKGSSGTPGSTAGNLAIASVSGTPVSPAYGATVAITVAITNSGQLSAAYSLSGYSVLSGAGSGAAQQGQFGEQGNNTTPITGSVGGNATANTEVFSGAVTYGNNIANYNASAGLDVWLSLTDTTTGATGLYGPITSAIKLPTESASSLAITSVTFSA